MTIYGTGFILDANIVVTISANETMVSELCCTTADSSGAFSTTYVTLGHPEYYVTATDGTNTATTAFTDPVNYKIHVEKVVEWNGATPDTTKTFTIVLTNSLDPSSPYSKTISYLGGTLNFDKLTNNVYTVSEDPGADWTVDINPTSILATSGTPPVVTVTNTYHPATKGTLIVKKILINDNGGTATAVDFSFKVNDGTSTALEFDGQNDLTVSAGTYSVAEVAGFSRYDTTYDNCADVAIDNGETKTCTTSPTMTSPVRLS